MASRRVVAGVACALLLVGAGCGGGEELGEGATATVYAGVAYCGMARRALESEGGRAGSVRVRLLCLPSTEKAGAYDLAQVGANARRATQDSTTVAYIGEPEPRANEFAETILREAGVAQLTHLNGSQAMHRILRAIREADVGSRSLREAVDQQLG